MTHTLRNLYRQVSWRWMVACSSVLIFVAEVGWACALPLDFLIDLNDDWTHSHQATPKGVPRNYSWASKPKIEAGNRPGYFEAITGWGHVFWSEDTVGHPGQLEIRSFSTFVCSGANRQWQQLQNGPIEGAEFRADFKDNTAKAARYSSDGRVTTVVFDSGNTFHFWPRGRARLPGGDLCGLVVLLQARTVNASPIGGQRAGGYLIGLGADYWIDTSAPWNNFKTNKGVGLGRLKYVGDEWSWFGMSTASDDDLQRLHASGLLEKIH